MSSAMAALLAAAGLDPARNYSLFTVPAAFVTCILPHVAAVRAIGFDSYDNANPRAFRDALARDAAVEKIRKQRILRAEAASANGFEMLGFFAAAVAAANSARLEPATLNALAGGYVLSRLVYALLYVNIQNRHLSPLRSLVWGVGIALTVALWVKAGVKMM